MAVKSHVSITKQREAYIKTKGICIICGKKLSVNESKWSVDHFIPRAIYKWVPDKKTKELIESADNIFVVHPQCNFSKDSALPTNQAIKNVYAGGKIKNTLRDLYKETQDSIAVYKSMKQSTLDGQKRQCALCGKKLSLNDATMRRINNHKGRNRKNAMCLCDKCNIRACSPGQKKKMINKRDNPNKE